MFLLFSLVQLGLSCVQVVHCFSAELLVDVGSIFDPSSGSCQFMLKYFKYFLNIFLFPSLSGEAV